MIMLAELIRQHPPLLSQDVVKVADILTRHFYHCGDQLLDRKVPIALSFNEMYSITQRLQLPRDAQGVGKWRTRSSISLHSLLSHNSYTTLRPLLFAGI